MNCCVVYRYKVQQESFVAFEETCFVCQQTAFYGYGSFKPCLLLSPTERLLDCPAGAKIGRKVFWRLEKHE